MSDINDRPDPREFMQMTKQRDGEIDRPDDFLYQNPVEARQKKDKPKKKYGTAAAGSSRVGDWLGAPGGGQAKRSWKVKSQGTTSSNNHEKDHDDDHQHDSNSHDSHDFVSPSQSSPTARRWKPPAKNEGTLPPWVSPPAEKPHGSPSKWSPNKVRPPPPPVNRPPVEEEETRHDAMKEPHPVKVEVSDVVVKEEKEDKEQHVEENEEEEPPKDDHEDDVAEEEEEEVVEKEQVVEEKCPEPANEPEPVQEPESESHEADSGSDDDDKTPEPVEPLRHEEVEPIIVKHDDEVAAPAVPVVDDAKPDPRAFRTMLRQGDTERPDDYLADQTDTTRQKKEKPKKKWGTSTNNRVDDWLGSPGGKPKRSWKVKGEH